VIWKCDPDPSTPPWALSSCWSPDGQSIYVGRRNGTVDEYDFKTKSLMRSLRMPLGSGSVSAVQTLNDSRHLLIASYDNIRYREAVYFR
jgi:transcriptional activator SPT8